jgi:hypothetical protein
MPPSTRCKFKCHGVTKRLSGRFNPTTKTSEPVFVYDAEFYAVVGDSPENEAFFEATPSGTVKIGTYREDRFEPGKSYYLDITEAPS